MKVAVLGASGGIGRQLIQQAMEQGHQVIALVRDPARFDVAASPALRVVRADVTKPSSIAEALQGADVVVSGLGNAKGAPAGALTAGAEAVVAAGPPHIVWLGAFGTGGSSQAAGRPIAFLLKAIMGKEIPDKEHADAILLSAEATVFHAGPLSDGPLSATRHTVALRDFSRSGLIPKRISRATVAAEMLDEAAHPRHRGQIVVPLG